MISIKTHLDWYGFFLELRKGTLVDPYELSQKIIVSERYKEQEIAFGVHLSLVSASDYDLKMVFGMQSEKNIKKEYIDAFTTSLKKLLASETSEIFQAFQIEVLTPELYNFSGEYFDTNRCGTLMVSMREHMEVLQIELSLQAIFGFFYYHFLENDITISKTIEVDAPTKANGAYFDQEFFPEWLQDSDEQDEKNAYLEKFTHTVEQVTLDDIILKESVKHDLQELVVKFQNKEHFRKWNTDLPKGILMYGPPGTGKTMIAKALANELGLQFFVLSSSDIVSKWVGESAEKLQKFLKTIGENSMVFMDEIDTLLPDRTMLTGDIYKNTERDSVVSLFLEYFDGMKTKKNILFVGATNNIQLIDPAVQRAGRFDLKFYIDAPDLEAREKIWKLYLEKAQKGLAYMIYDEGIDTRYLAKITNHFTGADIKEIVRRLMNDYSIGTLNLKDSTLIDPKKTYKGLLYHINKYKEEHASDRGIIPEKQKYYLSDIGGNEELKNEIKKLIIQIEHKDSFDELGVPLSKGLLLYGPPGTGKTLAAKVIANETNMLFYMLTAKDFLGKGGVEKFEQKLENLQSPSIVFIDEIESIGMNRSIASEYGVHILNTFLQKLDGFSSKDEIFFIGATNNIDIIDDALLRAGRFDRKMFIGMPDEAGRIAIFTLHMKKSVTKNGAPLYEDAINFEKLAKLSDGFVGADIKEVIRRLNQNFAIDIVTKKKSLDKDKISETMILREIENYKKERNFGVKKIGFGL